MKSLEEWTRGSQSYCYNGHDVFYRTEGHASQPTLLLIHGFPTASWDWHLIWKKLANDFRLITLDMMGYGLTDKPLDYDYSFSDQADLIYALCQHLKIDDVHLLSHDYGDTVAQELIARHIDGQALKIGSVVLLNGGLFPETHRPILMQKLLLSPIGKWVAKLSSYRNFKRSFDRICHVPLPEWELKVMWQLLERDNGDTAIAKLIHYMHERTTFRARWCGALQNAPMPVRLVDGIEDPISGAHLVDRYRELIENADIVELKGVGHYPQLEAPDAVLNAAYEFWSQHQIV